MVIIEFCLGIAFLILTAQSCWRAAGVIEWIMAFLGTGYMGLFAGFFIGYVRFCPCLTLHSLLEFFFSLSLFQETPANTNSSLQSASKKKRESTEYDHLEYDEKIGIIM